jgi:hypothetical protein
MSDEKKDDKKKMGGCGDPNCKGCETFRDEIEIEEGEDGSITIKIKDPGKVTPILLAESGTNVILSRDQETGEPIKNIQNMLAGMIYSLLPTLIRMTGGKVDGAEPDELDAELPPGTFPSKDVGNA